MMKIGIIGVGFVGSAIKFAAENQNIECICIDEDKGYHNKYESLIDTVAVFVCVPTPSNYDYSCNSEHLNTVLDKLHSVNYSKLIVSKSTATPDIYSDLSEKYPNLIHIPEFLTAANSKHDFLNAEFCIIGGSSQHFRCEAENLIRKLQPNLKEIRFCTAAEAALTKYAINTFLATKVIFMNEIYNIAQAANVNFEIVSNLMRLDDRIGRSHMRVPGPDGSFGFGGMCFPKDLKAFSKYFDDLNQSTALLEVVRLRNYEIRAK